MAIIWRTGVVSSAVSFIIDARSLTRRPPIDASEMLRRVLSQHCSLYPHDPSFQAATFPPTACPAVSRFEVVKVQSAAYDNVLDRMSTMGPSTFRPI